MSINRGIRSCRHNRLCYHGPDLRILLDYRPALRERTGAGMMECKKALVETGGDLDAAAEIMRKSGLAKADKKANQQSKS